MLKSSVLFGLLVSDFGSTLIGALPNSFILETMDGELGFGLKRVANSHSMR